MDNYELYLHAPIGDIEIKEVKDTREPYKKPIKRKRRRKWNLIKRYRSPLTDGLLIASMACIVFASLFNNIKGITKDAENTQIQQKSSVSATTLPDISDLIVAGDAMIHYENTYNTASISYSKLQELTFKGKPKDKTYILIRMNIVDVKDDIQSSDIGVKIGTREGEYMQPITLYEHRTPDMNSSELDYEFIFELPKEFITLTVGLKNELVTSFPKRIINPVIEVAENEPNEFVGVKPV